MLLPPAILDVPHLRFGPRRELLGLGGVLGRAGSAAEAAAWRCEEQVLLAVGETAIVLTLSLSITIETPTKREKGVQHNDGLAGGCRETSLKC